MYTAYMPLSKKGIRVHHLAKQLGVNSKDIVKKCADEGVDGIVNHQSIVSAGLSATIAEWFSDGADVKLSSTAVETGAKVDAKKAIAKAKKTTSKDAEVKKYEASCCSSCGRETHSESGICQRCIGPNTFIGKESRTGRNLADEQEAVTDDYSEDSFPDGGSGGAYDYDWQRKRREY